MIYAYDLNIQMPTKDLYDTQIMGMAIAAAKDMYDKGLKQLEQFEEKYGDFISPIGKDVDWYNKNVTLKVADGINTLYKMGIDPIRSAEGRAYVAKLIRSIDKGTINAMKTNAALKKDRLDAAAKLGDAYNPEMDKALNGDMDLFLTVNDDGTINTFNYGQPSAYKDIDTLFEPIIKNIKPIYDEKYTMAKNDGNDWYTITEDRLMKAVNDSMSDILTTPSGRFHYMQAKKEAELLGDPSLADLIFRNKISNRISKHVEYKPVQNPYKAADYKYKQAVALENLQHRNKLQRQAAHDEALAKIKGQKQSSSTDPKEKQQYTDSEWLFKRLTTSILGKTSVGKNLNIGNASLFDYETMSGEAMRMAQQELVGKYYANTTSGLSGLKNSSAPFSKVSFGNYGPTDIKNIDQYIGTGKMSWDQVRVANKKLIGDMSLGLSPTKFLEGLDREKVNLIGDKKACILLPEDVDRIYTEDYLALTTSGLNRPEDLAKAKQRNEQIRSKLSDIKNLIASGAGKIVGRVDGIDGKWKTFAKINLAKLDQDPNTSASQSKSFNKNNIDEGIINDDVLYIDLGIDSYSNPNYGINGDYNTNLTIDVNGPNEDSRNIWDANVNKLLRVGSPEVKSTIAIPELYQDDDEDILDFYNYLND